MRMQAHMGMNQQMQHVQNKQASPEIRQLPEEVVDTEKVNETEMNATRLTAAEMTKVLSQDQDPKYRQSEFFQFMSQIRDNEVEFAGNKVIDTPEKQDHISGVWDQPPPQAKQGVGPEHLRKPNLGANLNTSAINSMTDKLTDAWRDGMDGKEVDFEKVWQEATEQVANQNV